MFFKTETLKSTTDYSQTIRNLKIEIDTADKILIGAGAGLSASAGLEYGGKRFYDHFSDYAETYGLQDMYSAGFYPYDTLEKYWAYWSRHIYLNRYLPEAATPYTDLLELVKNKDYFIITTNVDHFFQKAGFDKHKLFYTQGDYGLWQCSKPCCQKTYENKHQVVQMVQHQNNMKIPSSLIPYCPHCGSPLAMNLRVDNTFVQDNGWHTASSRYNNFLRSCKYIHILYLELGVGYNTPSIIKYPFWQMTAQNPKAVYSCINSQEYAVPREIEKQTIRIEIDLKKVIKDLRFCNP